MFHRWLLVLAALLAAAGMPGPARSGEPTDQVRAQVDLVYATLQHASRDAGVERAATGILDRLFDWPRMAEATLHHHWQARTVAERAEFSRLFGDFFARVYLARVEALEAASFVYLGDTIRDDRATVSTRIVMPSGEISMEYATRLAEGGQWRVEDVVVDGVSLVESYRTQFDLYVSCSSYETLVEGLRIVTK
jgi:phospholipid transport system substrate-binding protein